MNFVLILFLCSVCLKTCIVTHECNGIDIITALILNDISPLCRYRMELVLQLKVLSCCNIAVPNYLTKTISHANHF